MIKKAIFPVGGLGTRFLPATKALPKEMLPVVDKPLIQYAVEEAAAAGIEEFIFVTGRNKTAIEDHFDHSFELEERIEKFNLNQLQIRSSANKTNFPSKSEEKLKFKEASNPPKQVDVFAELARRKSS